MIAQNFVQALARHDVLIAVYRHTASQADVAVFKAIQSAPDASKYVHAARWYKHIASYEPDFATLPGDASAAYSTYGPEAVTPAAAPAAAAEEDDDVDLFGSDDEEEDAEAVRVREERLAEYKAKKEAKGPKPAAKSIVTLDVKPWGKNHFPRLYPSINVADQP